MKKVAVIGCHSFSGSHFVDLLLSRGYSVIGISRSHEKKKMYLPYLQRNLSLYQFHALNLNTNLREILAIFDREKPESVVNFASQSEVGASWLYPEHWYQTNTASLVAFANALKERPYLAKYVHISTPEVYGNCSGWVTEDAPFNPSTPYAGSRAAADTFLFMLLRQFKFPVIFTRAANVYGPSQQLFKIIPRTFIYIKRGKKVPLHGGGTARRSFIHIQDVCRATATAMEKSSPGSVYHLSTDSLISIRDLVEKIALMHGKKLQEVADVTEERRGLDAAYILDSSKAKKELSWNARISLEEGLQEVQQWVDEHWDNIVGEPLEYVHQQ